MKLYIIEADINRRGFLRLASAAAGGISPIGKLLTSIGASPAAVQNIASGNAIPFLVSTNTYWTGSGNEPSFQNKLQWVKNAISLANRLSNGYLGYAVDENDIMWSQQQSVPYYNDAYISGRIEPKALLPIIRAIQDKANQVTLNGDTYTVTWTSGNDSIIALRNMNDDEITIYCNGVLPDGFVDTRTENPVKKWAEEHYTPSIKLDRKFKAEETADKEKQTQKPKQTKEKPEYYGSMHQDYGLYDSFTRRLNAILA